MQDDIGAEFIDSIALNKQTYEDIDFDEGIIFVTYSSLIAGAGARKKKKKKQAQSRLEQLLRWCGDDFDGCLLFDECHRAKNYVVGEGKGTRTGQAVHDIQESLPLARVVYCSATGVTDPLNMGYMSRLDLWGVGTPFPRGFSDFLGAVEKAMGMMELAVSAFVLFFNPPTLTIPILCTLSTGTSPQANWNIHV
jgi:hypothetical protein